MPVVAEHVPVEAHASRVSEGGQEGGEGLMPAEHDELVDIQERHPPITGDESRACV